MNEQFSRFPENTLRLAYIWTWFGLLSYPREFTLICSQASVVVPLPLYLPTNEEGV